MFRERGDDHAEVRGIKRVSLYPLDEDAAYGETLADSRIIFIGEKSGDAGDPWVGGLGDNEIVLIPRGEQEITSVIEDDVHTRVAKHAAIECFKIRSGLNDSGLDFDAINSLHFRVPGDR